MQSQQQTEQQQKPATEQQQWQQSQLRTLNALCQAQRNRSTSSS